MHSLGKAKGMGNLGVRRRDRAESGVSLYTQKKTENSDHLATRGTNLNLNKAVLVFSFSEEEVSAHKQVHVFFHAKTKLFSRQWERVQLHEEGTATLITLPLLQGDLFPVPEPTLA